MSPVVCRMATCLMAVSFWACTMVQPARASAEPAGATDSANVPLPPADGGLGIGNLAVLTPGRVAAQNGLWLETPIAGRFNNLKTVVVADIPGPAAITMIHFALPQSQFLQPPKPLGRDLLIRMYWDGETTPSVDCPLVDFFCDPAGLREDVNTAIVNKRRGWNAYFPMPFHKSARIELVYDGPLSPGDELWSRMPCYSYVMYRTADRIPADMGRFHACWRQEHLLLGERDYFVMEARGKGKFVGWNVTVRGPGRGYPVDENEKFYIDGEAEPSVEFQGIEDSFGFSWGYPETENFFPYTGYFPFLKGGAAAYRFFVNDAISFQKSLRVMIGFGKNEDPMFRRDFSKRGSTLQLSSTCYWYQTEPHAPLPPMPPCAERAAAPDDPFWPEKENLPSADDLRKRGVKLLMLCGRPEKEVIFAEPGFGAVARSGFAYGNWPMPVYHCRAADQGSVQIELSVPKGSKGTVRVYVIDPDNFGGGRKVKLTIAGKSAGVIEQFQQGRWVERAVGPDETAEGRVLVEAANAHDKGNAVISIVEWVAEK